MGCIVLEVINPDPMNLLSFKKFLCVAVVMGFYATSPVMAKDAANGPVASQDNIADWSGFYIGAHVGETFANLQVVNTALPSQGVDSLIDGGQLGYNWQHEEVVYGLEADMSSLNIHTASATQSFDEDWMATFRGRVGYVMGPVMPYATLGFAFTDSTLKDSTRGSTSTVETGVAAGAGLEGLIYKHWITRIEYLYTEVPRNGLNEGVGSSTQAGSSNSTIRLGINYKF